MTIKTIDPATGKVINAYEQMSADEVVGIIEKAGRAFLDWREVDFSRRGSLMKKAAAILRDNAREYAELITTEMGKPIAQAAAEIDKCAWICDHNAEYAGDYLRPREVATDMTRSYICYRPLGVIYAIMPWNFPFWQVFRFAAPNLMGGNVGLLSHAPNTTGAALAIEGVFRKAGFPENVFSVLIVSNEVSADVIGHPGVAAVSLTGSARTGRVVGHQASLGPKKSVLELGGSDPYLILHDADLEQAAKACVLARMLVSGQVCISPKRLIVVDSIYGRFEEMILDEIKRYRTGDPMDEDCGVGPLARSDLRANLNRQVRESIKKGAKCPAGGEPLHGPGFFYPPTLLTDVAPGMPAYDEELFGPVIVLIRASDEEDAIRIANDSVYGLGAAVFTGDTKRGEKIAADRLEAGMCCVNTFVASDPRLPFGGVKQSGYGRECALEGIREFMNAKTVNIE